jgi:membrane protein implicated in regulation of membrane protease activity
MKVIKAIYNFIVGDMIILVGVIIAVIILALISSISALAPLRVASGVILVVAVLLVLTATLYREARGNR